ncbi:hypothetical protein ACWDPV_10430 [Gordonia sp. NPDC003504]
MTLTLHRSSSRHTTPDAPIAYGFPPGGSLVVGGVLAATLLVLDLLDGLGADPLPTAVRALLVFAGILTLPGIPIVVALRIPGRALSGILIPAISLSVTVLLTQTTIVADWWSPVRTQAILAAGSLAACIWARRTLPTHTRTGSFGFDRSHWTRRRAIALATLAASLGCFGLAVADLDVADTGRFGVISALDPVYFLGLGLLAAVIVAALLSRRLDTLVLGAVTVVTVAYNSMLVGGATGETSIPTSFVHRGFIDVLAASHHLPDQINARFSWAGFFAMSAHVKVVGGIDDLTPVLLWAPFVAGVVVSFGIYAIAIAITGRARLAWVSVLLYHGFNWYQQDYYSPQSMAIIGYTAILGTLLWQLRTAPLPGLEGGRIARIINGFRRTPGRVPGFGPGRTVGIEVVLVVIIAGNTVSHQMTPMLTVLALAAFAATGTTRYRTLWLAAGLIFAAWFSYGATDFWLGHLQGLVDEVGKVGQSVEAGVGDRLSGDPTYTRMQYLRMLASGGFAAVGLIGWLIWRSKKAWSVGGLLCAAPFVLVALQSYGGEMIIRCFLLASPVLAPFAALALAAGGAGLRRRLRATHFRYLGYALLWALVMILALLETTNRGLNTAFEATARDEVTVTDEFIASVPPDATVMSFSYAPQSTGVRRILDPHGPRFSFIDSFPCLDNVAQCARERWPDYIYVTNQGLKMLELQYGQSPDALRDAIDGLIRTGEYRLVVRTENVEILRAGTPLEGQ